MLESQVKVHFLKKESHLSRVFRTTSSSKKLLFVLAFEFLLIVLSRFVCAYSFDVSREKKGRRELKLVGQGKNFIGVCQGRFGFNGLFSCSRVSKRKCACCNARKYHKTDFRTHSCCPSEFMKLLLTCFLDRKNMGTDCLFFQAVY